MEEGIGTEVTVVLVDDHPVVLSGLRTLLTEFEGLKVVGSASNGSEAVNLCRETRPDVLVLDLRIPAPSGPALVAAVKEVSPATGIVLLSTEIDAKDLAWATQAGVFGFVLKGDDPSQIATAVRKVSAGDSFVSTDLSGELLRRSMQSYGGAASSADLTSREREVLQNLVGGASNRQIARSMALSERTVKAHLTSIFGKLGVHDRTGAVTAAIRLKIVDIDG